ILQRASSAADSVLSLPHAADHVQPTPSSHWVEESPPLKSWPSGETTHRNATPCPWASMGSWQRLRPVTVTGGPRQSPAVTTSICPWKAAHLNDVTAPERPQPAPSAARTRQSATAGRTSSLGRRPVGLGHGVGEARREVLGRLGGRHVELEVGDGA